MLIAVVDVVVGPDVITLRRQLSELMPVEGIGARISNDSIVLEGIVPDAVAADRAVQIAETYAPGKVVNMLSIRFLAAGHARGPLFGDQALGAEAIRA